MEPIGRYSRRIRRGLVSSESVSSGVVCFTFDLEFMVLWLVRGN